MKERARQEIGWSVKSWVKQHLIKKINHNNILVKHISLYKYALIINNIFLKKSLLFYKEIRIIISYNNRILVIKALPKDIAALDKRSVLANVNSQGSGT